MEVDVAGKIIYKWTIFHGYVKRDMNKHSYKVVPQFGIAKLVYFKSNFTRVDEWGLYL